MTDRAARRARLIAFAAEFYRCPNSGVILMSMADHDSKILCGCGTPNPACRESEWGIVWGERTPRFIGVHYKRWLPRATVDAYLDQGPEGPAFRRNAVR